MPYISKENKYLHVIYALFFLGYQNWSFINLIFWASLHSSTRLHLVPRALLLGLKIPLRLCML